MLRLLILGAGGHAQVVADIALALAHAGTAIQLVGFLDDDARCWGQFVLGAPVLGPTRTAPDCPYDAMIAGIGNNALRRQLYLYWRERNTRFATLVHPAAVVARNVEIGAGTVLCAGAIVNTSSRIGGNVILNTACSVDHHNGIADHAHVAPGARLGGDVQMAEGALIGIGAVILPQRHVGEWAKVGAGAVVTRHVTARQTVAGVPARPLHQDTWESSSVCWSLETAP
jgi:sugar O-acyltransferase (sialic acid O-acetyltransferase NeuD family)